MFARKTSCAGCRPRAARSGRSVEALLDPATAFPGRGSVSADRRLSVGDILIVEAHERDRSLLVRPSCSRPRSGRRRESMMIERFS
jgi:hypothetical protein